MNRSRQTFDVRAGDLPRRAQKNPTVGELDEQLLAHDTAPVKSSAEIRSEAPMDLNGYLTILRRRKWQILVPAALLSLLCVAAAYSLPSVYRSTATILVEDAEVSSDLVPSSITGFAEQRIRLISQQVMTRANLLRVAEKFNLYPEARAQGSNETVLELMRKNIKLETVSAEAPKGGGQKSATIAFTLSFDAGTPAQAQQVASELTSLFLTANLESRQQQALQASTFLATEAKKIQTRIAQIEQRLAAFKERNVGRLPELQELNLRMRDTTEMALQENDRHIRALEERKFYLEGQLAQIKPHTPIISASGQRILDESEQLRVLQAQYAAASATYSPQHPDIIRMRREIQALETKVGGVGGAGRPHADEITRLRTELATAREAYSENHPAVQRLRRSLSALEESAKSALVRPESELRQRQPENPAYIALQSQLEAAKTEQKALRAKEEELRARFVALETRLAGTPAVEREYSDLKRELANEVKRYEEVRAKQMEAQAAQEVEASRKGQQLSLIDPPNLPEGAQRPNRPAIAFLGLFLSLGAGLGYGSVRESLDHSVRGAGDLARLLRAPPLAVIPYIENQQDRRRRVVRRLLVIAFVMGLLALLAGLVHVLYMPLDVFWAQPPDVPGLGQTLR